MKKTTTKKLVKAKEAKPKMLTAKRYRIEVTARDIARGKRMGDNSCPLALAIKRAGLRGLSVHSTMLVDRKIGYQKVAPLPAVARRFIANYDSYVPATHAKAKPFSFTLVIPA